MDIIKFRKITKIDHRNSDPYTPYETFTHYKTCTCTLRLTHTLPISYLLCPVYVQYLLYYFQSVAAAERKG